MALLPSDLIRLGGLPNEADRKLIKFCRKTLVRSAVISLRSFISSPTAGWVGQAAELGFNLTAKQSNLAGGFPMRSIFAVLLSSLAVLCALFVLISEDRSTPSSADLMQREKASDAGDRLVQALMLRRQRQSDYSNAPSTDQVSKAQEVLKNDGIYSGPVDGRMSQDTREAIRSFQQSHQLNMTGTIDDETARELGLQAEWLTTFHEISCRRSGPVPAGDLEKGVADHAKRPLALPSLVVSIALAFSAAVWKRPKVPRRIAALLENAYSGWWSSMNLDSFSASRVISVR
jgi:peptidoglycan hydrolase-like protein with peptidoglycan-binding domain